MNAAIHITEKIIDPNPIRAKNVMDECTGLGPMMNSTMLDIKLQQAMPAASATKAKRYEYQCVLAVDINEYAVRAELPPQNAPIHFSAVFSRGISARI